MIRYENLHKSFAGPVLSGVTMEVGTGEMFGLFGPSGTGKSVLLKTTVGLISLDWGNVRVDGDWVYGGGRAALSRIRRNVGYVFQNAALFDSLTVYGNVEMGVPEDDLRRLRSLEVSRRIWEALELVNLDPGAILGALPEELSGGMKKRVGIARAVVSRPRILLWDEPTTGLDPVNTAAVERLIMQLSEQLDVTSVIVTHDVEGALNMCDRVAMLEGGRLRFCGLPADFRESQEPVVRAFLDRQAALRQAQTVEVA